MRPEYFFEHTRVHHAVQAAERGSSARIVVYVSHRGVDDPMEAAHKLFRKLGLETEKQKAGLLFFFAPKAKKFAVLGGTGFRDKKGQNWWDSLASLIARNFSAHRYTEGVVAALDEAGKAAKKYFPSGKPRADGEVDVIET
jgi:uncharacterized membrane protein